MRPAVRYAASILLWACVLSAFGQDLPDGCGYSVNRESDAVCSHADASACETLFCPTCTQAHKCDASCGFCSLSTTTITTSITTTSITTTSTTLTTTSTTVTTLTTTSTTVTTTSSTITTTSTTVTSTSTTITATITTTSSTSSSTSVTITWTSSTTSSTVSTTTRTQTSTTSSTSTKTTRTTTSTGTSTTTTTCYTEPDDPAWCNPTGNPPLIPTEAQCNDWFPPDKVLARKCDTSCYTLYPELGIDFCTVTTTSTSTTTSCFAVNSAPDDFCEAYTSEEADRVFYCSELFCHDTSSCNKAGQCDGACGFCTPTTTTSTTATTTTTTTVTTTTTTGTSTTTSTITVTSTSTSSTSSSSTSSSSTSSSTTKTTTTTWTTTSTTKTQTSTSSTTSSSSKTTTSTTRTTTSSTTLTTTTRTTTSSTATTSTSTTTCYYQPNDECPEGPGVKPGSLLCSFVYCDTCPEAHKCDQSCEICTITTTTTTTRTTSTSSTQTTSTLTTTTTTWTSTTTITSTTVTVSTSTVTITSVTTTTTTSTTTVSSTTTTSTLASAHVVFFIAGMKYDNIMGSLYLSTAIPNKIKTSIATSANVPVENVKATIEDATGLVADGRRLQSDDVIEAIQVNAVVYAEGGVPEADIVDTVRVNEVPMKILIVQGLNDNINGISTVLTAGPLTPSSIQGLLVSPDVFTTTTVAPEVTSSASSTNGNRGSGNDEENPPVIDSDLLQGDEDDDTLGASFSWITGLVAVAFVLCVAGCLCGIRYMKACHPSTVKKELADYSEDDKRPAPLDQVVVSGGAPEDNFTSVAPVGGARSPATGDSPGKYEIIVDYTAVGPTMALGSVTAELEVGTVVEVTEVVFRQEDERIRGRIVFPSGWISLCSTEDGATRRWARKLDRAVSPGSSKPRSPQQLTPSQLVPSVTDGGTSPGSALPGGFVAGEQVVSMVDFSGASGSVSIGEVGTVVGPCRGYSGQGAQARLNCKFPKHPNINLKSTQIRKVEEGSI